MAQTVQQALAQAELYTDGVDYAVVHLPPTAITVAAGIVAEIGEPFCGLIIDKDEVSLIIPAEALDDFAPRLRNEIITPKKYRLITFDLLLEMDLVGFIAWVGTALAEANIPILPLAAFSRDHLLVPADQINIAMVTLEKLKSSTYQ